FSSRRRHTRFSRDWSSDVCSSDLVLVPGRRLGRFGAPGVLDVALSGLRAADFSALGVKLSSRPAGSGWTGPGISLLVDADEPWQLGRASCRECGWRAGRGGG